LAQELPGLDEPASGSDHPHCRGVAQPVRRTRSDYPRPAHRVPDHRRDCGWLDRDVRGVNGQEHLSMPRASRTTRSQVGDERLADIDGQRELVDPASLANDRDVPPPVQVLEPEPGGLSSA